MLSGISEEHIIQEETEEWPDKTVGEDVTRIRYNQTDPNVISDGVDVIEILEDAEDLYQLKYWGYWSGLLTVTEEGSSKHAEVTMVDAATKAADSMW
ncbi:hypothetical protein [Halorussus pelagicus]|uniref:hypothetical protein n=1 Tax=Halorussus pelagicus TaxID=2505977 RepID=UPI000FFBB045|nr:hypothetical protein [Halorussus pelagicus]